MTAIPLPVTSLKRVTYLKRLIAIMAFTAIASLCLLGGASASAHTSTALLVGHQATAVSQQSDSTSTTVLLAGPAPDEGGGVIPLPNSGVKPQSSGDRGGWAQLTLWALIVVGLASMFGRIAWGMYKHSRANPVA
ncbi:MAG: hypothetical protein AB7N61_00730 [Acidimicrobiia bacterium]